MFMNNIVIMVLIDGIILDHHWVIKCPRPFAILELVKIEAWGRMSLTPIF